MYIRFVVGLESENHRELTGLITEAKLQAKEGRLEECEIEFTKSIFDWFNDNMPCPPFSANRWPENCSCWFKDSAKEFIEKMWELAAILEASGSNVRVLRAISPGKILYEDEYQVVVDEWRELNRKV